MIVTWSRVSTKWSRFFQLVNFTTVPLLLIQWYAWMSRWLFATSTLQRPFPQVDGPLKKMVFLLPPSINFDSTGNFPNTFCQSEPVTPQAWSYFFNKGYMGNNYQFEGLIGWSITMKCYKVIIFILQLII